MIREVISVKASPTVTHASHASHVRVIVLPAAGASHPVGDRAFTYRLPDDMHLTAGQAVLVPFGKQRVPLPGLVLGPSAPLGPGIVAREVIESLSPEPILPAHYLAYLAWVADWYATPLAQVITVATPPGLIRRTRASYHLVKPAAALAMATATGIEKRLYEALEASVAGLTAAALASRLGLEPGPLQKLLDRQLAAGRLSYRLHTPKPRAGLPKPIGNSDAEATIAAVQLCEAQQAAVTAIVGHHPAPGEAAQPFLLYGITGSGKTQVYFSLIEKTLAAGKGALVLVPEIALTPQLARLLAERFGAGQMVLWHSHLSASERRRAWQAVMRGEIKLVVGARSALFAPIPELGLIVLDEEHEGSYKQDAPAPRYHAHTLATELARRHGARLVFGSATPDVTTYHQTPPERLLRLPTRYGGAQLAEVDVIDTRQRAVWESGQDSLTEPAMAALRDALANGEQAIVLINRRGLFTVLHCASCGHTFQCPHCDVNLTVHQPAGQRLLRCHWCGYEDDAPDFCPQCAGRHLETFGVGTQRVTSEINARLPEARVERLDGDIMQRRHRYEEILGGFARHETDILVGTQMVAKGMDVAKVTTVVVVGADAALSLPDVRAGERAFQLLVQVAGRAGRGERPGRVLFQTSQPGHPVIQFAAQQHYEDFVHHELAERQRHGWPPFYQLFRLIVTDEDALKARQFAEAAVYHLRQALDAVNDDEAEAALKDSVTILGSTADGAGGVAPCLIPRLQGRYRFHTLIQAPRADTEAGASARQLVSRFYREITPPAGLHFLLDLECQSIL